MGFFHLVRDPGEPERHQHPTHATFSHLVRKSWFKEEPVQSFIENMSSRWLVKAHVRSDEYVELTWHYFARGAWPADFAKPLSRLLSGSTEDEALRTALDQLRLLGRVKRLQLCGHDESTANCDVPRGIANELLSANIAYFKEHPDQL